jgi:hypothetical protein
MAKHNLNFADEHFINSVLDTDELTKRVPRLEGYFDAVQEMKSIQAEISTLGKFTKQSGFWPGRNFQRLASIPYSIVAAIVEVDPEFFRDRGKVYRFLAQHPEYDTRTKVS